MEKNYSTPEMKVVSLISDEAIMDFVPGADGGSQYEDK